MTDLNTNELARTLTPAERRVLVLSERGLVTLNDALGVCTDSELDNLLEQRLLVRARKEFLVSTPQGIAIAEKFCPKCTTELAPGSALVGSARCSHRSECNPRLSVCSKCPACGYSEKTLTPPAVAVVPD